MIRRWPLLLLLPFLVSCAAHTGSEAAIAEDGLTNREAALAADVVRRVIDEQDATVTRITVASTRGIVKHPNTGQPCLSGRELRIKLIGTFPHIVTTGHPVLPGQAAPDTTASDTTAGAMLITADAETGEACLIGIEAPTKGEPLPIPTLDPTGTPLPIR